MFNKSYNLHNVIADLYPTIRKAVLFSLVGSINAQLINAADRLAQRLEEDGYDFRELQPADYQMLCAGTDETDGLSELRKLCRVGNEWRAMLRHCDMRDDSDLDESERPGSIHGTVELLTGRQKMRNVSDKGVKALAKIGIVRTDEQRAEGLRDQLARDQQRADARAKRKAAIYAIYDTVFDVMDNSDTEYFTELSVDNKERLCTKFFGAINNAIAKAVHNVEHGMDKGDALGIGDICIMQAVQTREFNNAFPQRVEAPVSTEPQPIGKPKRVKRVAPGPLMEPLVEKIKAERLATA